MEQQISDDKNNFWAENSRLELIHINNAVRGKGGYFCPSCGAELQAKKGDQRIHHYAHDPQDRLIKGKCDYSDESYRHKMSKEILQRILKIKVPSLFKMPPMDINGLPMKIQEAIFITASKAEVEMSFYEDEHGEIKWGRNPCEKYLVFRPDVAFFDDNNNPILLIELVASNKINDEKYHKIACIGIDTVQVIIPPHFDPQKIEKNFLSTTNTKWVYNYEYESRQYEFTPNKAGTRISHDDEIQTAILDRSETYECKAAKIKGLLRRIRNYMGSEQFRAAQNTLSDETSRVESNIRRKQQDLQKWQGRIEEEIQGEFESEEVDLGTEEGRFQEYHSNLESRYNNKRKELDKKGGELAIREASLKSDYQGELDEAQQRIEYFELEQSRIGSSIKRVKDEAANEDRIIQKIQDDIGEGERRIESLGIEYYFIGENVRKRFENERNNSIGAVASEDYQRNSRISSGIKEIVDLRRIVSDYREADSNNRTLQRARKVFDDKSYKSWIQGGS